MELEHWNGEWTPHFTAAWWGARSLTLYRRVLDTPVGCALMELLEALAHGDEFRSFDAYYRLEAALLAADSPALQAGPGSLWQRWLVDAVLMDDNPFTRRAEWGGAEALSPAMRAAAVRDLAVLHQLFRLDGQRLKLGATAAGVRAIGGIGNGLGLFSEAGRRPEGGDRTVWDGDGGRAGDAIPEADAGSHEGRGENGAEEAGGDGRQAIVSTLFSASSWSDLVDALADYYHKWGAGDMARYAAFRWRRTEEGGVLEGVEQPDPIRLTDLVGYEEVRRPVIRNTVQFLRGLPANNVLLYGDRGTGKSATVKAILNEFRPQGLRLVELPRPHFADLGEILARLKERPQRFILFVDDLSFEEDETDYKYLKALLEGSVEARPDNVLVYATSNRRHLVSERFSDRPDPDEKRPDDTAQEKLSLADRFGLTVVFPSPDQEAYMRIVEGIAQQEGLDVDRETLRRAAARWVLWHNERSARTARQFIDDLKGRHGLGED